MCQFMTRDVCFIKNQMYSRILSFCSGVKICWSRVSSESLGEKRAKFTKDDIPSDGSTNPAVEAFLNAINTSCRALGQTSEAAKNARKGYFDYIGRLRLNSVLLTVTPDVLRIFRVRLCVSVGQSVRVLAIYVVIILTPT